jgi:serine/threonine protein kinase
VIKVSTTEQPIIGKTPDFVQKLQPGQKITGNYTLKAQAASCAGMTAWTATGGDPGQEVVLGFLPVEILNDQRAMEAIRKECRLNRQVIHPHMRRVFNLIEEKGWAAVVMEKTGGETVDVLLKKLAGGCFDPSDIKVWLGQLCQTMEDAHRAGLLHRGLAPSSLVIDKKGDLKIDASGIRRVVLDSALRGKPANADPTLAYQSPQILDGETAAASDDIYAFGVLMHEMLAGKPPFEGGEIVQQIRRAAPASLTERRSQAKPGGAPVAKHWDKIIASCLEKQRNARPKSFAEIATKLGIEMPGTTIKLPEARPAAVTAPAAIMEKATPPQQEKPAETKPAPAAAIAAAIPEKPAVETKKTEVPAPVVAKKPTMAEKSMPLDEKEEPQPAPQQDAAKKPQTPEDKADRKESPIFPHSAFIRDEEEDVVSKTRFPFSSIAAAAVILIGIGIAGWLLAPGGGGKKEGDIAFSPSVSEDNPQITQARNREPKSTPVSTPAASSATPESKPAKKHETPAPTTTAGEKLMSSDQIIVPAPTAGGSALPADLSEAKKQVEEKAKAAEQARLAAEKAEKSFQDTEKARQDVQAEIDSMNKALAEKTAAIAAVRKAGEEKAALIKQMHDAKAKADAEAEAARKAVQEKERVAAEVAKSAAELDKQVQESQKTNTQAEAEARTIQKTLAERTQAAAAKIKAAAEAKTARDKQADAAKKFADAAAVAQQQLEKARAAETARKAAEEVEKQRFAKQQQLLQQQAQEALKAAETARKAAADAERVRIEQEAALRKAEDEAKRILEQLKKGSAGAVIPALPLPTATPVPVASATPSPVAVATPVATPVTTPAPVILATPAPAGASAISGNNISNSIGMKFAPVGNILFCIWPTRVADYQAFVQDTGYKSTAWLQPGFKQGPDHPVVNVSWADAINFCRWLTENERKAGTIASDKYYRLPSDTEWSNAVCLPEESGRTPEARDMSVPDIYPWGGDWPPPAGAGNYTGEETRSDVAIKGYNDSFPWTSPVGSFKVNKYGLYDMGGNVWQWCMDSWNSENRAKVLRGGSWYNGALKLSLLSSCRIHASPDSFTDNYGFRVVIDTVPSKAGRR